MNNQHVASKEDFADGYEKLTRSVCGINFVVSHMFSAELPILMFVPHPSFVFSYLSTTCFRSAKKFALTMAQVDEFVAHDHFISSKRSESRASSVGSPPKQSSKRESPPSSPASSTSSLTSIALSSVSSTVPLTSQTKGIVNAKNCSVPILITRNTALLQVKPRRSVTVLTRLPTGMVIVSQDQKAVE
jgi:hypothetical protein